MDPTSMKKVLSLLLSLLVLPTVLLAQSSVYQRNDDATTTLQSTNLQPSKAGVDTKGSQFIRSADLVSDTTLNMTSTASAAQISCGGNATFSVQFIRTTETGTVQLQASNDGGTTWQVLPVYRISVNPAEYAGVPQSGSSTDFPVTNAPNTLFTNCSGFRLVRVKVNAAGTGTALPVKLTTSARPTDVLMGIFPGTDPYMLGKAEDAAAVSGDVGVAFRGKRADTLPSNAGTDANGDYADVYIGNEGGVYSSLVATTVGGYTKYSFGALVGTVQIVKGTAGTLGGYHILNSAATICYLQIFDVASATTVTLGTTVPDLSLGFPIGAAANIPPASPGIAFTLGIKLAATTTRAGSTPCGTGMDVNIFYK